MKRAWIIAAAVALAAACGSDSTDEPTDEERRDVAERVDEAATDCGWNDEVYEQAQDLAEGRITADELDPEVRAVMDCMSGD